jgi:hypothetical protein
LFCFFFTIFTDCFPDCYIVRIIFQLFGLAST